MDTPTTYTVRVLGHTAWEEGIPTYREARASWRQAADRLGRNVRIIRDVDGVDVTDPRNPVDYEAERKARDQYFETGEVS